MLERVGTLRFRRPEYTGENRCLPCTGVNLVIVVGVSILFGYWRDATVGFLVAVLGVFLIYVRGYVVPGTPVATRRYLPEAILAWFDHQEGPRRGPSTGETASTIRSDAQFDPETILQDAGALRSCPNRDDLCLDEGFRRRWHAAMNEAIGDVETGVTELFPGSVDAPIAVEFRGETIVARVSETTVAQWPSRAAAVADIAGGSVLAETDEGWEDRDFTVRTQLLGGFASGSIGARCATAGSISARTSWNRVAGRFPSSR